MEAAHILRSILSCINANDVDLFTPMEMGMPHLGHIIRTTMGAFLSVLSHSGGVQFG